MGIAHELKSIRGGTGGSGRRAAAAAAGRPVAALLAALTCAACAGNALHPIAPPGSSQPVERLSELGIFEGDPAQQIPRADFVPYDVNAPLFANGAHKRRFLHVPPGTRVHANADRWELPVGSYLVKTFSFPVDARDPSRGERLVETRFLVKTSSGPTASTYLWNEEQTDAVVSGGDLDVPVSWIDAQGTAHHEAFHVPGTSECASCYEGRALGLRSRQLDRPGKYADGTHDQIAHWLALGIVDAPTSAQPTLADPFGDAPLETRARSYLDANCSHCHGAGGSAEDTELFWDLEHTDPRNLPVCRPTPEVDGRDRVLVPGHPEQSEFLARMLSSDADVRMPRGATHSPDHRGIEMLSAWVASMTPKRCR